MSLGCQGPVVIVGAGQAGAGVAASLRALAYTGPILLIGDEAHGPYERPPLSKDVMLTGRAPDGVWSSPHGHEAFCELRLDATVVGVARVDRRLLLADGSSEAYGALVVATGGRARSLPGLPVDGERVFALRTLDDALALHRALSAAGRVLVVGGGWLGLEVAATARTMDCEVTLLETADRLCPRSLPLEVAAYLLALHRSREVEVVLAERAAISATAEGVELQRPNRPGVRYDLAVVAIGMAANDGLAREAGLATDDGILTDALGRTADPAIFAVGDVARFPIGGENLRLENWQNAADQSRAVAAAILGQPAAYVPTPWFWSEQFGQMIQVAGLPHPSMTLIDFESGERPLWRYGRGGVEQAIIGIGRARDLRAARQALGRT